MGDRCDACLRAGCGPGCGCVECKSILAHVSRERLRTLASNLAVAGALCAAFDLGALFGGQWMARDPVYPTFEPGCQSKAPSGESLAALQQKVKDALTACGWPSPVCRNAGGGR